MFIRKLLFAILVLTSTFEKTGVPVVFGGRAISVDLFKALLMISAVVVLILPSRARKVNRPGWSRDLVRMLVVCIAIQTICSLLGLLLQPGETRFTSEVFYLLQRGSVLLIPWLAVRSGISPQTALRLFVAAVCLHDGFGLLQYISPSAYQVFVAAVHDDLRVDNSLFWAPEAVSFDFIGLQTTSNYGVFAASFGLLVLGLAPKDSKWRMAKWLFLAFTALVVLLSPSRSVLLMLAVATFVAAYGAKFFTTTKFYLGIAVLAAGSIAYVSYYAVQLEMFVSVYAFSDPNREGSNMGHLQMTELSFELIRESPFFGYGQRRFTDLISTLPSFDGRYGESHSFYLSTLISTGGVGLIAFFVWFTALVKELWRKRKYPHCNALCAMLVGLAVYNAPYDAGHLGSFACFLGIASYAALWTPRSAVVAQSSPSAPVQARHF